MAKNNINWNIVLVGGVVIGGLYFWNKLRNGNQTLYTSDLTRETFTATQPTVRTDLRQSGRTQRTQARQTSNIIQAEEKTERAVSRQDNRTTRASNRQNARQNRIETRINARSSNATRKSTTPTYQSLTSFASNNRNLFSSRGQSLLGLK